MNTKIGLIIAAWAISCGSAFLIGRTSTQSPELSASTQPPAPIPSSRAIPRGSSSASDTATKKRRSASRSSSNASPEQLEALALKVRNLKNLSDPIARAEGFLALVRDLGPDEFLAAVAAYREGGINNEQFSEYRLLLTAWADVDPIEALSYASENTGTPYARQTILTAWAKNNPEAAVNWARENFDNEGEADRANPWMVGVIEGIAPNDLGRATQLLEELPFSRSRAEALDAIYKEVAAGGNEDAKLWVAQLTDPRLKEGAANRLAGDLATEDPRGAAEWAASLGPDVIRRSAGTIIDRWAAKDLDSARDWVDSQAPEVTAAAGSSLVQKMIQQEDLQTAATWLSNHEGDPAFDDSVRTLVWNSMRDEPVIAADWIMKLTDEGDQARTFHRVLGRWMENDKAAAVNYITNNDVPESIARRAGVTK